MNGILAKKMGMTQLFLESGERVPVTVLQAGPCQVVQQKTVEQDGYQAVQVGFQDQKESRIAKPQQGHFKKAGVAPKKYLAEFEVNSIEEWEIGKTFDASIFEGVKNVVVTGVSKGRGFQGTVKRYNFSEGPRSHGTGNVRAPGSIGACSYPGRTFPGQRMPGQYGNKNITVKNLNIVKIDVERNLIFIKGAVPGPKNGLIKVRKA
jgi:large subunit ribosomal protein L3